MRRKLSLRFLLILLAVVAVIGVGGHFLHGYQERRTAVELRQRAQRAADAGHLPEAIREYQRYLSLAHEDAAAWADYSLVLDKSAKTPKERMRVVDTFERALRLQGDRDDIRKRLVQTAMDLGLYSVAKDHLKKLLEASPKNAELFNLLGRCLAAETDYAGAAKVFAQAIEKDPAAIDNYVRLVELWRHRLNKADQTQAKMDEMVKANNTAAAYVARARYYRQGGAGLGADQQNWPLSLLGADVLAALGGSGPDCWAAARSAATGGPARATFTDGDPNLLFKAGQDVDRAIALAPDDADVLLEAAELERSRGWVSVALRYSRRALDLYPEDPRPYAQVADLASAAGRRDEALDCLRRGVKALPDDARLHFQLAVLLIQDGRTDEVEGVLVTLKKLRTDPAVLDYLDGCRKASRGEWLAASNTLETAYPGLGRFPDLARQAALLLGKCYEQLGDPDQEYGAYRRAFTEDVFDPQWFPAAEGVARSLLAMNKVDDALDAYRRLIPRAPAARLVVVRLLIMQNARLPKAQRQWAEVDRLLAELSRLMPKSVDVAILQAHALAARAQDDAQTKAQNDAQYREADAVLKALDAEGSGDVRLSAARADIADKCGKSDDALAILDDAEKRFGDPLDLRLARLRHTVLTADRDTALKALGKLEEGADHFNAAEQLVLRRALADAYATLQAPAQARRLWEQVVRTRANDLGVRIRLFDLALLTHDDAEALAQLNEIRRLEGERGTLWRYCTAARLIERATGGDRKDLDDAHALLILVGARRPAWHRVPVGEARIAELSGNTADAIRYYLRAIDLGERDTAVLLKTIQLLYEGQQYDEAYQVIRKLPEQAPLLQRLSSVAIDLSLRNKDTANALTLARKAVSDKPDDYRNHLALGRVLWALDKQAEAEESLRRAIDLAKTEPEPSVTLVQFFVLNKRLPDAEKVVDEMAAKLPVDTNRLAFAQCYLLINKMDKAGELYRAALADKPRDPATLRAAIEFALRTEKTDEAKQLLRRLIALKQAPGEAAAARELLALLTLAEGSGYQPTRAALEELHFLKPSAEVVAAESLDDKRARATVLALQPTRDDRAEALRLFEEIAKIQPLNVPDQFLVAQLHRVLGQWPKARTRLQSLLAKPDVQPAHVAYYVQCLLERKEADEAGPWVAKLEALQPNSWRTVELKARWLAAQQHGDQAAALLTKYADGKDAPLAAVALLLDQLGQPAAAEGVLDKLAKTSKKPEITFLRAGFLARHGRLSAALDLCEDARAASKPEVIANVAVALLYQADPTAAEQKRVERWLEDGLRSAADNKTARASLQQDLAALYNLQGRFQDSEAIYRRCAEQDSTDALAANNLAWFLALQRRNSSEALALIQRAIDRAGPKPGLLDTRAIVYLALDKPDLAVKDMEEVVGNRPTAAGYFHLARAYHAANNPQAARDALSQATRLGLREKDLHPLERDKYAELNTALRAK